MFQLHFSILSSFAFLIVISGKNEAGGPDGPQDTGQGYGRMHDARRGIHVRAAVPGTIPGQAAVRHPRERHFQAQGKDHRGVRGYGERAAGLHAAKPEKFGQHPFLQPCDPRIAPVEYLQDGAVLFPVHPARFERVHARTLRSVRRFDRTEPDGARADQGAAERLYQNGGGQRAIRNLR